MQKENSPNASIIWDAKSNTGERIFANAEPIPVASGLQER